jgi:hypothetical protein
MLTHKDPEVQVMLGLLENQRDYLMGLVAAQAKQLAELNAKLEAAMKETGEPRWQVNSMIFGQ